MEARINRALSQRLCFIETVPEYDDKDHACFRVAGTKGTMYRVTLALEGGRHACTCWDFKRRHVLCKHVYFMLFKYFQLDVQAWLKDKTLMPDDLDQPQFDTETEEDKQRRHDVDKEDTSCVICCEDIGDQILTYCDECGHRVHSVCMATWLRHSSDSSCPYCRTRVTRIKHLKL